MKKVTIPAVKRLVAARGVPSISIYMNADPVRPGSLDDRLRLRAHLRRVSELLEPTLDRRETDALLTPIAERALDEWPDARSVAFLRSHVANEAFALPLHVPELAMVSSTFHTKPLVSVLDGGYIFVVLGISDDGARFYEGTRDALEGIDRALLPAARTSAMDRGSWHRAVDASLCRYLAATEKPVVLAGEHRDLEAFRAVSRYPHILDRTVECDLAQVQVTDLLEPVVAIVDAHRAAIESEAAVQYLAAFKAGHATDDLAAIGRAAVTGRVPLLVHRLGAHVWGVLDRTSGDVTVRRGPQRVGDADVVDDLCEVVLQHGGDVVEIARERMPCASPVGVIVRPAITAPRRRARRSDERAVAP